MSIIYTVEVLISSQWSRKVIAVQQILVEVPLGHQGEILVDDKVVWCEKF